MKTTHLLTVLATLAVALRTASNAWAAGEPKNQSPFSREAIRGQGERMRTMLKQTLVAGAAFAVLALASASLAAAGTMQVSGGQAFVTSGACYDPAAPSSYTMSGSLVGCWYIDTIICKVNLSGTVQCTGTEHFVGSIGGSLGTMSLTFQGSAKFGGQTTFGELHGRSNHLVVGGTGDFSGASGVLYFQDDITTNGAGSAYTGHTTF